MSNDPVMDLSQIEFPPTLAGLVNDAKDLYNVHFSSKSSGKQAFVTEAPGRVNLIGEHVDYTGGFVLPFAINFSTIVYGTGRLVNNSSASMCRIVSTRAADKPEQCMISPESKPPTENDSKWTNYVMGVVAQYLPDLPKDTSLDLSLSISGNVPIGSGLSSSASLEVAVARFMECILQSHAYSSSHTDSSFSKLRALRCQKAENEWCHSPCGIMDQYVSSAASEGAFLLIDCSSFEYEEVTMVQSKKSPIFLVTNSNVCHDIAGGEYPIRVAQCKTATAALQKVHGNKIQSLRNANLKDVEAAKSSMDEISYKRARHVVTENDRTLQCKLALQKGDFTEVGVLMNASHTSMRDDYEVSCEEINILVESAQAYSGVFGSRLTGGGFGGCTVTLVERDHVQGLIAHLMQDYLSKTGKECICFETSAGYGARLLATDTV